MTFASIWQKLTDRWLLVLVITIIAGLSTLSLISEKYTVCSITVGANPNSPQLLANDTGSQSYVELLPQFTNYLNLRFSSIVIQDNISRQMGLNQNNFSEKVPFYTVSAQSLGFVNLSYQNFDEGIAKKFSDAVKIVYKDIIEKEWNNNRQTSFVIKPMDNFLESITYLEIPIQTKIVPTIAGFVIGLSLAIFIPSRRIIK